eukprot:GFUD01108544.1.p1 GENE.GFUD01108544.1~~GFUD01108544.1.p1  ORF type:complete len:128 (-),score=36.65 GFUD01108544.1:188-571(-)
MGIYNTVSATVSASSRRSRDAHASKAASEDAASSGSKLRCPGLVPFPGFGASRSRSRKRSFRTASPSASASQSSDSEGSTHPSKSAGSRKGMKKEVAYVKTWEDSLGHSGDQDDLWVIIDLKMVIKD